MRPLRLEMEGFSTFRDHTVVEFDADDAPADLVAFVGPTGSGKSTVIDAITFALYGSVARYGDARLVAPVINQQSNEAKIRLDFEVGGVRYTAIRVVRRTKSGATTREARLQRQDEVSSVVASGAKELTVAVEELLGLDFAQFTRTVVLPQGQFAEFLNDDPASRQRLLRRLLDFEVYSRMGVLARERAKAASTKLELLDPQIEGFGDATLLNQRRAQARAIELTQLESLTRANLASVAEVEEALVALRQEVTAIDVHLKNLDGLKAPADLHREGERLEEARGSLEAEKLLVAKARTDRQDATDLLDSVGDPNALRQTISQFERLEAVGIERSAIESKRSRSVADVADSQEAAAKADQGAELARHRLARARSGADASAWISSLVIGEACPVCAQTVGSIPDHDPVAELASAQSNFDQAAASVTKTQHDARAAQVQLDRTSVALDALVNEHAALSLAVTEATTEADNADTLRAKLQAASEAGERQREASEQVRNAERAVAVAESSLQQIVTQEQINRRQFGSQRDGVAAMSPPQPGGQSLVLDWSELQAWGQDQRRTFGKRRELVAQSGKDTANKKAVLVDQLESALSKAELGIDLKHQLGQVHTLIARAVATAEADVKRLEERRAERAELVEKQSQLVEEKLIQRELGQQLSASGFERWLLSEALEDLVGRATERLLELSKGQFSLATDQTTFKIVDHNNAEDQRDVRTLSGGETFLASLALALALSDSIADMAPVGAPRLGSVFLDEGFGTLDPETLDVVASAIEDLSASGRLVGIVTHIEALAERMPVRYVVSKGPTSSVVTRVVV